jgi:hypothetical protein
VPTAGKCESPGKQSDSVPFGGAIVRGEVLESCKHIRKKESTLAPTYVERRLKEAILVERFVHSVSILPFERVRETDRERERGEENCGKQEKVRRGKK